MATKNKTNKKSKETGISGTKTTPKRKASAPKRLNNRGNVYKTLFENQKKRVLENPFPTYKERIHKIEMLRDKLLDNTPLILEALKKDFQKPESETYLTEIYPVLSEIRFALRYLKKWMKPHKAKTPRSLLGTKSLVEYQPKGVVLIIAPWNYIVSLSLGPLVSAIAAGNRVILKPSELTSHTSNLIAKMVSKIYDQKEVAVVEGDATVAGKLLDLPFNHIFFTGSPRVGKIVMEKAAKNLSSVTLELGGKSPVVIDETADIKEAANKIIWGKLLNCGQTCIAPDYLFVHASKAKELLESLKLSIEKKYGKGEAQQKENNDFGRIINGKHLARISRLLNGSLKMGAKIEYGGQIDLKTNFLSATILKDVQVDAPIMQEEIFGPILPVMEYTDIQDVIDFINSQEKPLAAYFFGKDKKNIQRFRENTFSGGLVINDTVIHFSNNYLPFGGVNNSGIGNAHGLYGFKAFSHERAILIQKMKRPAMGFMYPPYNKFTKKMIDLALKYF